MEMGQAAILLWSALFSLRLFQEIDVVYNEYGFYKYIHVVNPYLQIDKELYLGRL